MSDQAAVDAAFRERVVGPYASVLTSLADVRAKLDTAAGEPEGWLGDAARKVVETAAEAAYATTGRQKVLERIDRMAPDHLRTWLQRLVSGNMRVGAAILAEKGDD